MGSSSDMSARAPRSATGSAGSTARRWCCRGHVRGDAARRAAAVDRARRHDRSAPRTQPGGRRRCGRHQLRLVAGVLGAGDGPRHDVRARRSSASARCSTISSSLLDNQPLAVTIAGATVRVAGDLVVPVRRRHRSLRPRAADPDAPASSRRAARTSGGSRGSESSRSLVYSVLFAGVHAWLFDALYPRADAEPDGRAHGVRASGSAVTPCSALLLVAVQSRVRLRAGPDRRGRSAQRARALCLQDRRFVRRHPGALRLYLLNGGAFLGLVLLYALLAPGAPRSGVRMWLTLALGETLSFLAVTI